MRHNWTPIKRGSRYCSPSCGYGCTVNQHGAARLNAKMLAGRLGKKWQPHVWENLGWHFEARLGNVLTVSPHGKHYWCTTQGNDVQQVHAIGETPNAAVRKVQSEMRRLAKAYAEAADSVSGS